MFSSLQVSGYSFIWISNLASYVPHPAHLADLISRCFVWAWKLFWCLKSEHWGEYFDLSVRKWREHGENYITRNIIICKLRQILLPWSSGGGWDGRGMQHARARWEMRTKFSSENLKGRDNVEDLGIYRRIMLG